MNSRRAHVIYITTYCGQRFFDWIQRRSGGKQFASTQTFNSQFIEGLKDNGADVEVLTYLPVAAYPRSKIMRIRRQRYDDLGITTIPFLNIQYIKQLGIAFGLLACLIRAIASGRRPRDTVLVCDYLYLPTNLPVLLFGKLLGIRTVAVVPDVPDLIMEYVGVDERITGSAQRIYHRLAHAVRRRFSGYILFSRNMAGKLGLEDRPWIEIEGMYGVDGPAPATRERKKVVLYAGGLYKEYGILELLDSMDYVHDPKVEYWICGSGRIAEEVKDRARRNDRIKYLGVLSQRECIALQKTVEIVINPRPALEEFTKYSFPSKTFEYLVSGATVIMARLPSVPEEYYEHIRVFEKCEPRAIAASIDLVLELPPSERSERAEAAFQFVKDRKSPLVQCGKVRRFLESLPRAE